MKAVALNPKEAIFLATGGTAVLFLGRTGISKNLRTFPVLSIEISLHLSASGEKYQFQQNIFAICEIYEGVSESSRTEPITK
jgi:hypothetical protein